MIRHTILAAAVVSSSPVQAANLSGILGPISPVYDGNSTGTVFTKPGWFPDAQFPLVWGGANEPDTNLSWWIPRHSGSMRLDYALQDGSWVHGQYNSPDERGYWITTVYRPVDVDPALRGTTVTLTLYPDNAVYGTPTFTETHVIDDNYLVGFAHIEDWNETTGKEVNGSRTVYSYDNGKTWKKGPLWSLGVCTIDKRTIPGTTRLIHLGQDYMKPGWKQWTTDIAKGVEGYQKEPNAFSHGNLYGVTGVVWSRYLNKWLVMFSYNGSVGKDLQFTTTENFGTYSPEPTVSIERNEVPGRGVVAGPGDYPTLLGGFPHAESYPIPFNMEMGQLGWVYNKNNGLSGRAIHFIAPVEKQITWTGADADNIAVATISGNPAAGWNDAPIVLNGKSVASLADEDGDGVANLIEYATGGDLPGCPVEAEGEMHFSYQRSTACSGVTTIAEWSEDLSPGSWKTEGITEVAMPALDGSQEIRATMPNPGLPRCFMRLKVVRAASAPSNGNVRGPIDLGGGISVTLANTAVSKSGGSSTWTFSRSGPTDAAQTVSFGISGTAEYSADYSVSGAATFDGATGSVIIPAGATSASLTTTPVDDGISGADKTIVISAVAAVNLAGTGNWSQSSGAFTGIIDETHTLNFTAAAGAVLNNDIPSSKRVRSINLSAASGDHTINGNRIELEAVNKWLSTGYAMYGINQYSANTATFNTDINTRTAALYLRPWVAGGKIILNGKVDMLGSGGVVISGAGDVEINGDLVDSGYSDFTTGQPEFVASVNPGRLIMVGDGKLTLAGDNTFAGRSEVGYGGRIKVRSLNALRNSVLTIKRNDGLIPETDLKIGGLDGKGNLDLGGHHLTLGNHNPPTCYSTNHTGIISGSGSITKIDTNTQRLGAVNQHSGGITIKGGVLEIPASNNTAFGSGTLTLDGGTLRPVGTITANNPVHIGPYGGTIDSNGRTILFNGSLSGSGTLYSTGNGTLALGSAGTFSGTLAFWNTLRVIQPDAFGTGSLRIGGKLVLGGDQFLSGLTTIAANTSIDTGPHTLTVDGPINIGAGRTLVKSGSGKIVWHGDSSALAGDLIINGGNLETERSGDLSHGNLTLNGAGLSVRGSAVAIAREPGTRFVVNGAARLLLDQGDATSLDLTLGSAENPDAFVLGESSAVLVQLGASTRLFAPGRTDTPGGDIFPPSLILSAPDLSGDFAVYSAADGFTRFNDYAEYAGDWSVSANEVVFADITDAAKLIAESEVKSLRVSGSSALTLTSRTLHFTGDGTSAGLILNNGSLTGGNIDFGPNKGYIYVGGQDATISSAIRGTGGIVFTGLPGTKVALNSWTTTYSPRLTVAGTTVVIPNYGVMGESGTPVTIDGRGTLGFPQSISVTRELTIASGGGGIDVGANATFSNSGPVIGSGEFRKTGLGTVKWNVAGSATGAVHVEEGTIDYSASAFHSMTGPITVAAGARVNANTTNGAYFHHDFNLAGYGPAGEGALGISGSGKTSSPVTLSGPARIRANSGATFAFEGTFNGQGNDLDFSGSGRFGIHGGIHLDAADLSLSGTPYLSIKSTSAITCGELTTAAGSTLELNTANTRIDQATITGTLLGVRGKLTSTGPVMLASGGRIAGGLLDTPALFTIDGDLEMATGSTCYSYLKGATGAASDGSGGLHGQILVTGSGTVGGTLKLVRDPSFTPNTGDEIFVMLRNGGSGNFTTITVEENGASTDYPGAQGTQIIIGGKTGVIRYDRHSSINLSNPTSGSDISIKF